MESNRFIKILCAFLFLCVVSVSDAQVTDSFDAPWKNPQTAIVIDAYYNNLIDWKELQTDRRVVGILHKATENIDFADPAYQSRRNQAKSLGYKWGSYHLLRKGDPIGQAKFYLKATGTNNRDEIMALDIECTVSSQCGVEHYRVSLSEIKSFLKYIEKKTGRLPIFYANQSIEKDLSANFPNDKLLVRAPLWYARFKAQVTDFPLGIWKTYTFWQFSSEINCKAEEKCLYRVPGTLSDMDINVYNGSPDKLRKQWGNIGK